MKLADIDPDKNYGFKNQLRRAFSIMKKWPKAAVAERRGMAVYPHRDPGFP